MRPGTCKEKCFRLDFAIPVLFKQPTTFWSSHVNRYRTTKPEKDQHGRPKRATRYTTELRRKGLAKCKVCVYITAKPIRPGIKCPCCKHQLSQSIRDIKRKPELEPAQSEQNSNYTKIPK
jgi:hypothetical protein